MNTATAPKPRGLDRFSDVPAWVATMGIVALLLHTVAGRLTFPYDLEWMEGGILLHAWRVFQGDGIYVEPTSDYIPFIYPPLYHWLVAGLGKVFGFGYTVARGISIAGTLIAACFAVAAARLEGVRWGLALGAAGLYLSSYEDTGAFFDLTRIDGLFMALTTGALVAGRAAAWRAAGLLLTLAFATKHNAALFGLPILIWAHKEHGRDAAIRFALWSILPALAFTTLTTLLEGDGLFLTYIVGVPGTHGFVAKRFFWTTYKEVFLALPVTTLLLGAWGGWLAVRHRRLGPVRFTPGGRFWLWNGALAVLLSAIMRGHQGGFTNVLMPAMWAVSLGGVIALERIRQRTGSRALVWLLPVLLAGQLGVESWDPDRYRATDEDREAGDKLVEAIANIHGEVLAPWSPWLAVQAGKKPHFHLIGLWDIDHQYGVLVDHVAGIRADVEAHRWAAVLVMDERMMPAGVKQFYRRGKSAVPGGPHLQPKTGWRIRPRNFWFPRDDAKKSDPPPL